MKLRKLTLQGYKTFASKTEFVFDSGITAIVGPNGSGKSNVADALRWVLGEQSYSTLRARRSADMIFAGSQQRARAGMAQATITLDNSDGWLPIDFTEVEIARRSFRSGENEYLINGQQVRLKDIADLLATSGLAERTYTIIGQGLIDQALSLRSDERRALFEEAAGITHYKTRRAETLRRLDETQRNLQRVHDILEELKPRVSSLRRQATRTRNYEQISADLHALLRIWYGYKWEQAKTDLRAARKAAKTAEVIWARARENLLAHQGQLDEVQARIAQAQQESAELLVRRDELRQQLEEARRIQAIHRERRAAYERQIVELEAELPHLETATATARIEVEKATADLALAQSELQTNQAQLQEFRVGFASLQAELSKRQGDATRLEGERRRVQNALAQANGQLLQLRTRLEELQNETDPAEEEDGEASARLEERVAEARAEVALLRAAREEQSRARSAAVDQLKGLRLSAKEGENLLGRLRADVSRLEERIAALERRQGRTLPLDVERVVGRLVALIRIPREHETAIAGALGERLSAWLVNDVKDLWQAVNNAPRDGDGQLTRLLVAARHGATTATDNRPSVAGATGVIAWANEVVAADKNAETLVDQLLGGVLLVADSPTAYRLAAGWPRGYVAVAPDGFTVHGGGLVEMGGGGEDNALTGEARRREQNDRLDSLRVDLAARESETTRQQAAIEAMQEQVDAGYLEEQRLNGLATEAGQRLAEANQQLDRIRQRRDYLSRRRKERQEALERSQTLIEQTETNCARQTELLSRLEAELEAARTHLAALPTGDSTQEQQSLRQTVTAAQTILAGRQAVVDSRRATLNQGEGQLGRLRQRLSQLREQLAGLSEAGDESGAAVLQQEMEAIEDALAPLVASMETNRAQLARLQADSAAIQRQAHELETQLTQTRIRLTQHENQIEGLQERIRGDMGLVALSYDAEQTGAPPLPIEDVVEKLPVVSELPADIEENIHHFRGQLHRIGPVNPDAPAELAETEERFVFLTQQVDDLTRTDEQLRGVIAELDELTSKAFAKTVEQVNEIFDDMFKQLFGGGSGRLVMTDPDDPTSSGVEIIARLPNRREQGLALLSGGERSLTAAALIFSLLKVAPPPFCVLDEVDAALDEANVNRFRDIVRELGRQIQFILITHNRGTVQAAQTLYGVSMQPDSSSQVISIKPEEYARPT